MKPSCFWVSLYALLLAATIDVHELSIHPGRHEATLAGRLLDLTYTEFALLTFLARRPGWAFSRAQIVDAVMAALIALSRSAGL